MEAVCLSEPLVTIHRPIRRHLPEDSNPHAVICSIYLIPALKMLFKSQ
jgi:hypothetical protein